MAVRSQDMRHEDIEALLAIALFALGMGMTITLATAYVAVIR